MTKKIYISPSDQTENRYAWGNTNEHAQCQRIAEAEAAALRRSGVEVKLAAFGTTMAQRCAESDAWGADIHSCVHTNAFNGKVSGTRMFCYSVPGKGYDACRAVFGQLAPLTPGTSENIQANPRLYEVRNPAAPSVYCECEFHDSIQGARWIVEHTTDIGEAIAKGLCEYLGAAYVPARQEARRACPGRYPVPGPGGGLRRPRQRREDAGPPEKGRVHRVCCGGHPVSAGCQASRGSAAVPQTLCFVYSPLYFRRVARPPRMWRWALFSSSTSFTCRYSARLYAGRRSDRSLCTVDLLTPNFLAAERTVARFSIR